MWKPGTLTLDCDPEDPNFLTHDVNPAEHEYISSMTMGRPRIGGASHTGPPEVVKIPGWSHYGMPGVNVVINVSQMADPTKAKEELWNYLNNNKITTSITITGTGKDLKDAKIRCKENQRKQSKKGLESFFYNDLIVLKKLGFEVTVIFIDSKTNKPKKTTRI